MLSRKETDTRNKTYESSNRRKRYGSEPMGIDKIGEYRDRANLNALT